MKPKFCSVFFACYSLLTISYAHAADGTWTANAAGNWSTSGNWSGVTVADGPGFTAYLSNVISGDRAITLDTSRTIGNIHAQDTTHNYSITGGILTLDVISGAPIIDVVTGRTLTISGSIHGNEGLTKTGLGTLTLSNTVSNYSIGLVNQFTGATTISNGKILLTNVFGAYKTAYGLQNSVYDTTGSTGAIGLDITGVNGGTGNAGVWLGGLAGSVDLATAITSYSTLGALILNPQSGTSASYGGVIANGAAGMTLTKNGQGSQTLSGTNTYTGATIINAGTLTLSGADGSILNSAVTVRGGMLSLDNTSVWVNRVSDTAALSLGSLTLTSFNGAGEQTETVGATAFSTGGKVTIINGTTSGDQTTLAMGAVTRSAGAAIDFVGVNGALGSGADSPNVTGSSLPLMTNGIYGWATVNGTQWAENNAGSIRAYSGTFVNPTSTASDATKNAQVTGSGTMNAAKSFNSLNVISSSPGESFSLGTAGVLTLTSGGGILKSGTEAYTISGSATNSITSGSELITHVDGGVLTISAKLNPAIVNIAKGGSGDLILSGTRAATLSGAIGIAGGNLEFQGATTVITGLISGGGGLIANLNAGQTLNIKNVSNNFTGQILIKRGMLSNGDAYNTQGVPGGGSSIGGLGNIEINGGTLGLPYYFGRYLGSGSGQIQITGGTSGFTAYGGAPTFTLNGTASYEVVWGTTYFNPTTLVLNDTQANNLFNFQNKIDLNGATRTVAVNSTTQAATISSTIRSSSGPAGLTKIGAGTLILAGTGANTYNGLTTVTAGTLSLNKTAGVNAIASNVGGGGNDKTTDILVNGGNLNWLASNQVSDNSSINVTSGSVNFGSANETIYDFNNSGGSVNYGTGNVTILDPTWSAGTNEIHGNTTFGVLNISGGTNTVFGTAGPGGGPGTLTAGSTGGLNFSGTASPNLTLNSDAGTAGKLVLAGNVTSTVTDGTASITSGGIAANPGQLDLGAATRTFTVDNGAAATDLLISAQVMGSVGLNKDGAGTLELSGTNIYTGATNVTDGTLVINGNISTSILTTASGNGATLAGNGTLGETSIENGATLSPGVSGIGTLNMSSLTLGSPSTLYYELTGGGSSADLVDLSGALTITSGSIIDLVQLGTYTDGDKFTVIAYDGVFSGTFTDMSSNNLIDGATFTDAGGIWMIDYNDATAGLNGGVSAANTYVTITSVTAIPEPNVAALLGSLGVLMLLRRRRN